MEGKPEGRYCLLKWERSPRDTVLDNFTVRQSKSAHRREAPAARCTIRIDGHGCAIFVPHESASVEVIAFHGLAARCCRGGAFGGGEGRATRRGLVHDAKLCGAI